jgi:DNA-binding CsgD family transcriptional regulator
MNLQGIDDVRCESGEVSPPRPAGRLRLSDILSKRQKEILLAACRGLPEKIIADELGVSPRTLEGHWRAIHRKLGSLNRCQAGFLFASLWGNTDGNAMA